MWPLLKRGRSAGCWHERNDKGHTLRRMWTRTRIQTYNDPHLYAVTQGSMSLNYRGHRVKSLLYNVWMATPHITKASCLKSPPIPFNQCTAIGRWHKLPNATSTFIFHDGYVLLGQTLDKDWQDQVNGFKTNVLQKLEAKALSIHDAKIGERDAQL